MTVSSRDLEDIVCKQYSDSESFWLD